MYRLNKPTKRLLSIFEREEINRSALLIMRLIYVRVRVINRICMILHNPRILHIATERNHMNGFEKVTIATTRKTEDRRV